MFASDKSIESLRQLFIEFKKYLNLQQEYTRLEVTEKLSVLLSMLILVLLTVILCMMALFYLSFTLAWVLAPAVGSITLGFSLIAILYIILALLLVAFRKRLIIDPMVKFLARLFLKPTDKTTPAP